MLINAINCKCLSVSCYVSDHSISASGVGIKKQYIFQKFFSGLRDIHNIKIGIAYGHGRASPSKCMPSFRVYTLHR